MKLHWTRVAAIGLGALLGFSLILILSDRVYADADQRCDEFVPHEHGLLCNSDFVSADGDIEIKAGRALLWYAGGSERVHRMWLTDGVRVRLKSNGQTSTVDSAEGTSLQAEYRIDQREIALLGNAALRVGDETVTGERIEYSLHLGRLLRRSR